MALSDVAVSNRTFIRLFRRSEPGVKNQPPGGAGVRAGSVPTRVSPEEGTTVDDWLSITEDWGSEFDRARECLVDANEDEVGCGVCERAGAGVAAHAPGGRGVLMVVRLSGPSLLGCEDRTSITPVSSSEDEGGPGSSGRPFGGEGVCNSILEVLKDGWRGGVESPKEGALLRGGGAEGAEVSLSSLAEALGTCPGCADELSAGEVDCSVSVGGIPTGRTTGVGASCILSSLSENMRNKRTPSHDILRDLMTNLVAIQHRGLHALT
jgi:hypothetical protein